VASSRTWNEDPQPHAATTFDLTLDSRGPRVYAGSDLVKGILTNLLQNAIGFRRLDGSEARYLAGWYGSYDSGDYWALPKATVSPGSIDFGSQPVGTSSAARDVTVASSGSAPLAISRVAASGDFAVTGETCTAAAVAPGGHCTISVSFIPGAAGLATGFWKDQGELKERWA